VTGQVTALGIRDGDPAVLQALVDRRGFAVLAYCERACPPGTGIDAAADAFARFRETVLGAARPAQLDPEAALLSATRHAAADRVPRPAAQQGASGPLGRLLGGRAHPELLDAVPELLVARADGMLDAADEERLVRLLDGSAAARAVEQRFLAAEHAYRTAAPRPISSGVRERIVATMAAAVAPAVNGTGRADPAFEVRDAGPAIASASGPVEAASDEPLAEAAAAPAADEPPAAEEPATEEPVTEGAVAAEAAAEEPATEESAGPVVEEPPVAGADGGADGAAPSPELEPALTQEWALPPEAAEIAAARLTPPAEGDDEEAAHLQSASGAVDEPLVDPDPAGRVAEVAAQLHRPRQPAGTGRPAVAPAPPRPQDAGADTPSRGVPRVPGERHALPGRAALAPAGAVVTIAAIGALAASGVFGGNEPSPPLDTGIVPPRALQAVPEGEAEEVVDDLRGAAADARRRRLADRRQALAAAQLEPSPETTTGDGATGEDTGTGDSGSEDTTPAPGGDAAPAPEQAGPDTEAGGDSGGGDAGTAGDGGTAGEPPTVEGDVGGAQGTAP